MQDPAPGGSARRTELLEGAYTYVLEHGLADLSLRPLAAAVGSSPRVLLFLFGSKEGLVKELLARARREELELLDVLRAPLGDPGEGAATDPLIESARRLWSWLRSERHRRLLVLWVEGYSRSLVDPDGAWAGFAHTTVDDWMIVLAAAERPDQSTRPGAASRRAAVIAVLRGALLGLLATGDREQADAAVGLTLDALAEHWSQP